MKLISRIRTLARVRPAPEGDLPEVAETVAVIMDGNGRWARRRGLPTALGHRAGTRALRRMRGDFDQGPRLVDLEAPFCEGAVGEQSQHAPAPG